MHVLGVAKLFTFVTSGTLSTELGCRANAAMELQMAGVPNSTGCEFALCMMLALMIWTVWSAHRFLATHQRHIFVLSTLRGIHAGVGIGMLVGLSERCFGCWGGPIGTIR